MKTTNPSLFRVFATLLFLTTIATSTAQAKDLTSRLGMGYTDQFSTDTPSIAVKYHSSQEMAFGASLGVATEAGRSRFGFMGKIMRSLFVGTEENMIPYMGAGAGLISQETGGSNASGFELSGFIGAEFFLPGLDSLGFSFEAGVGVTSISSGTRFRTIGDSPLRAGIYFYF